MTRDTIAEIHLSAFQHNYQIVQLQAPQQKIIPVIKADAYGHGSVAAANALPQADAFAVAFLEEALVLREAGIQQPILLLEGVNHADEWLLAVQNNCWVVIHGQHQLDWLKKSKLEKPVTIWLKINTGMNRLGIEVTQLESSLDQLKKLPQVKTIILMTHFACADEPQHPLHQQQLEAIRKIRQQFPEMIMSCANSAAILSQDPSNKIPPNPPFSKGGIMQQEDWVRPGIMLYGSSPFSNRAAVACQLKPVMHLKSRIIACRELNRGDAVGYGATWVAVRPSRIAVLAIGYADGYSRVAQSQRAVWIHDRCCPVIGRVSMDTIMIDVTDHPQVQLGDWAEIWGEHISVDQAAKAVGTIGYELLSGLTRRVPRVYLL